MPGGSRSLPGRPSLRHLKLEAKRRVATGEFPSRITSTQHVLVIAFIVGGVIAAAVWIFLAKSCQRGQS